jgi:hypothetical protein
MNLQGYLREYAKSNKIFVKCNNRIITTDIEAYYKVLEYLDKEGEKLMVIYRDLKLLINKDI